MLAGALLTALGILGLMFHKGIRYTGSEQFPRDGDAKIVTHEEKYFSIPLAVGGAALAGGIAMMIVAARK